MPRLSTVAIVGRPNVGKSTLFNRLVGRKLALVDDRPGVTRDRREGEGNLLDLKFRVVDTAGYEDEDPETLPGRMRQQTEAAVRDADVALFLIDGRQGLTPRDKEIGRWLRAGKTPVVLTFHRKTDKTCATEVIFEHDGKKVMKQLPLGKPASIDWRLCSRASRTTSHASPGGRRRSGTSMRR